MKYRIVKHYDKFRVQYRFLLWWRWVTYFEMPSVPLEYNTQEQAELEIAGYHKDLEVVKEIEIK